MTAIRMTLLTDHPLFAECLRSALATHEPAITLDAPRPDEGTLQEVVDVNPDVVIVDQRLGKGLAIQWIAQLARRLPEARIIALGTAQDSAEIVALLEAGASEFLSREDSMEDLLQAIERAIEGHVVHPPELARATFARLHELAQRRFEIDALQTMTLSRRELEVLRLISAGMANKQIARQLHLSLHTVKNHIHRILEKLGSGNRLEAVQLAQRNGWIPLPTA